MNRKPDNPLEAAVDLAERRLAFEQRLLNHLIKTHSRHGLRGMSPGIRKIFDRQGGVIDQCAVDLAEARAAQEEARNGMD